VGWAWSFSEDLTAAAEHACTTCGATIGRGDNYRRDAVPPWGYEERGEDGQPERYSIGLWTVRKMCTECAGLRLAA
jgi:hypothetical protein